MKQQKMKKISFLMAAHNEEKIISKTINHLISLPYENYEIIVGLDGCTDNTEKIIKNFMKKTKKLRYYKLNLRQGKPAVINQIVKKAKGEIIIINDADWIFNYTNKENLKKMVAVFDNRKIGGIAESFPVEWEKSKIREGNLIYKMVAYSSYQWFNFQKEEFTEKKGNISYLKTPTMFLTNILRKKLYKKNTSLGDDFERTSDIMNSGYDIVLFNNIEMPRMIVTYDMVSLKDLFKQKIRTATARNQIKTEQRTSMLNYYLPATWYIFKNSWKQGLTSGFLVTLWLFIAAFGTMISKFKRTNTKEGWKLRMRR